MSAPLVLLFFLHSAPVAAFSARPEKLCGAQFAQESLQNHCSSLLRSTKPFEITARAYFGATGVRKWLHMSSKVGFRAHIRSRMASKIAVRAHVRSRRASKSLLEPFLERNLLRKGPNQDPKASKSTPRTFKIIEKPKEKPGLRDTRDFRTKA